MELECHLLLSTVQLQVMNNTVVKLHGVIDQLQTDCLSEETQEEVGRALGLLNDAAVSSQVCEVIFQIKLWVWPRRVDNFSKGIILH